MVRVHTVLVVVVLILLALGVVMLASTSSVKGGDEHKDPYYFLKRQLIWLVLALVAGTAAAYLVDYHLLRRVAAPLAVLAFLGLLLVYVPHVGCRIYGARRWIRLGALSAQPSELAKFAVVVMLAAWMTRAGPRAARLLEGLVLPGIVLGAFAGIILLEPDYGTCLLVGTVGAAVMFVGGTRVAHLAVAGAGAACGFVMMIMRDPERARRVIAFIDPSRYPEEAYQLKQSEYAFTLGGAAGKGLGQSIQKHAYLPEAQTDFIFAILGEELGMAATLTVIVLFIVLLVVGTVISLRAGDVFGRLLGFGLTAMLSLQAVINVGVVTGCLPTKGLPLPYISAGGSSLVMCLFSTGVLVNISRHAGDVGEDDDTRLIKDQVHSV